MDYDAELAFAVDLAHQAGKIMRAELGISSTTWKADNSPVTEADTAINDLVIQAVQQQYPTDGVLGEEASLHPERSRKWVVDPIDGTRAFDLGAPLSTFCLGLVVDDVPVLGVVYDPYLDKMYSAATGQGAFVNGSSLHVSATADLARGYMFITSSSVPGFATIGQINDRINQSGAKLFSIHSMVYGYMRIATGDALAALAGAAKPWDLAAAFVILQESGAVITDFAGQSVTYGTKQGGVVVSNGAVHPAVLAMLNSNI